MCNMQVLSLKGNKIGDPGITALADALGKGALASLETLNLGRNQVGDTGLSALASALTPGPSGKGALDKLEVRWCPTALSPFPETSHVHSPNSYLLFDVPYAGALSQ
jgi:hypothetical protein